MEELNLEPPVLLVDGYNMCGYWPKLKKHFAKGDLETARSKLVVDLQTYGACKGRIKTRFSSYSSYCILHETRPCCMQPR
jgi:predicted RNA-binding protein with PIN domain